MEEFDPVDTLELMLLIYGKTVKVAQVLGIQRQSVVNLANKVYNPSLVTRVKLNKWRRLYEGRKRAEIAKQEKAKNETKE